MSTDAPDGSAPLPRALVVLERLGVALLLLAGLVPRIRDLGGSFDREMEGFQGSCFANMAVNYERLGVGRFGGYPVLGIDLPEDLDRAYHYPNHPPLVPLFGWATLKLFGPEGWNEAWRRGEPPGDVELPLRLPFLIFHLAGLLTFWWAVRQASGPRAALLALALLCASPISIVYAELVNYENPCYAFLFLGLGFHARWLASGGRNDLSFTALFFMLAAAVTYTPVFFLPALFVHAWVRRGFVEACLEGILVAAFTALPLVIHAGLVGDHVPQAAQEGMLARARVLLGPLLDGSIPLLHWLGLLGRRVLHFLAGPTVLAALAGAAVLLVRTWRGWRGTAGSETEARTVAGRSTLALELVSGGFLLLLGFYTHTSDGRGLYDGQTIFLINLAPGVALLAAHALDALAPTLGRLRGGFAPLALVASLLVLPSIVRANEIRRRWREPVPSETAILPDGSVAPLPREAGAELGTLVPPGAVAFYPRPLGLTVATSFYAWRTLIPTDRETWEQSVGQVGFMGLEDAPRYILLPRPLPAVLGEVWKEIRDDLERQFELVGTSPSWELWPSLD